MWAFRSIKEGKCKQPRINHAESRNQDSKPQRKRKEKARAKVKEGAWQRIWLEWELQELKRKLRAVAIGESVQGRKVDLSLDKKFTHPSYFICTI